MPALLERSGSVPRHVAVIMDGNGRWAKKRRLPRLAGHRAGTEPVRKCVRTAARIGIEYLTLYTFSLENWSRPRAEVAGLMLFLEEVLRKEILELDENGVRLNAIGRLDLLPAATRAALDRAIDKLAKNRGLVLTLALSYGGRAERGAAARHLGAAGARGRLRPEALAEARLRARLYDPSIPDPDLLVRTSGELRVSNFMLWQIAYAEIWVTDVMWPDFTEMDLIASIRDYQQRDRRYGLHSS